MNIYPEQRVSRSQRTPEWWKANADYFKDIANFSGGDYAEMRTLARAADGNLIDADYTYILNPYSTEDPDSELNSRPARLRNYPLIKQVLKARQGERSKFPFNYQAIVTNGSGESAYLTSLNEAVLASMAQDLVNNLNQAGIPTGVDSKEIPPYEQIKAKHDESWSDKRAIFAQDALDYIKYDQDLIDKYQDAYENWLYFGRCFTYKSTRFSNVELEVINPFDIWWERTVNSNFIEDSPAIVVRRKFKLSEILDRFRDKLKPEDITYLESQQENLQLGNNNFENLDLSINEDFGKYKNYQHTQDGGYYYLYHICWKSMRKVGILQYIDGSGTLQEKEVDDTYKLDREAGDLQLDWEWDNEWLEQCVIDENVYFYQQVGLEQRNDLNNSSICKLPYNGRVKLDKSGNITSDVKDGLVYQCLFNIYHYNREKTINKSKDKLLVFPVGLIPPNFGKGGTDPIEKMLSYIDSLGIAFFDETQPNAAAVISALKEIDLSLGKYVEQMTQILESVKQEYWDTIGFNRQRFGETYASDGKGVNEQALFRSSIITAEDDRKFDKFIEKDLNGLIDYTKVAWIDGKKAAYIIDDVGMKLLNLNQEDAATHMETNYGVFITNSQIEYEKLEALKKMAFGFAQKGNVGESTVTEILDSNNFSKLKKIVAAGEKAQKEYQMALTKQQTDSNERVQQMVSDDLQAERDLKKEIADDKNDTAIEVELIRADAAVMGFDNGMNGEADAQTIEKMQLDREKMESANRLKERQLNQADKKMNIDNKNKQIEHELKDKQIKVAAKKKAST